MKTTKLSFSFSQLWNSEYPLVVERILEIVSKHNPEELGLKKAYDRIVALNPELEKIKIQEKTSAFTDEIVRIDKLRDRITTGVFNLIYNFKRLNISPYTENAKTLDLWLSKYGKNITKENYTSQTEKTNQFISEMEGSQTIKNAVEALHLTDLLARIKQSNQEFETLFRSRTAEFSNQPTIDVKAIRQKVDKELKKLFIAIDFCANEHEEKDYKPLIEEIHKLLNYHRAQIKSRRGKKSPLPVA